MLSRNFQDYVRGIQLYQRISVIKERQLQASSNLQKLWISNFRSKVRISYPLQPFFLPVAKQF